MHTQFLPPDHTLHMDSTESGEFLDIRIYMGSMLGVDLGKVNRLALHHEVASMPLTNLTIHKYNSVQM